MSPPPVPAVLRAYADLCGAADDGQLVVAEGRDLLRLGPAGAWAAGVAPSLGDVIAGRDGDGRRPAAPLPARAAVERFARLGALHDDEDLVRLGWCLLAGTARVDGEERPVLLPLVSRPVRVESQGLARQVAAALSQEGATNRFVLRPTGDPEGPVLVADPGRRAELAAAVQFGGGALEANQPSEALIRRLPALRGWIDECAGAAGLRVSRLLPHTADPLRYVGGGQLVAVLTTVLYLRRRPETPSVRNALLNWAARGDVGGTALSAVLSGHPGDDPGDDGRVDSPLRLTSSQADVVRRSRRAPVTVVSGPPGTGKTHTLCAVALDVVARGGSVLVATSSRYAADVVGEQLRRIPGPDPVRFGDGVRLSELVDELRERQGRPLDARDVAALDAGAAAAAAAARRAEAALESDLRREADAAGATRWEPLAGELQLRWPALFSPGADPDAVEAALAQRHRGGGVAGWWRRARAARRLEALTGSAAPDEEDLRGALALVRARRAAAELAATGGTRIAPGRWTELAAAEGAAREALGRRLAAVPLEPGRLDGAARGSLANLVVALGAGRERRRALLAGMDRTQLTAAAPLWIGTLAEIEDVLPPVPGLFDVVVLDEASQVDQPRAAPALLRALRAVVVGDPHQLRHVDFRPDALVDEVLARHGLADRRAQLDVRRSSVFDLAAAGTAVDRLREHFRSVPHLVAFSLGRFYGDRVDIMTRHPATDTLDAIDVVRVRDAGQGEVVAAEVEAVVDLLRRRLRDGTDHTVGVVSPFRAQARAVEAAVVDALDAGEIGRLSLRVGTVHAFQGGERDEVVVALGLRDGDPPGRRRFVQDPNLFNVMVTRARRRCVVVTALDDPGPGLLADYLRHADHPPPALDGAPGDGPWAGQLAEELRRAGLTVRTGYQVGPWRLDVVVGDGAEAVALDCGVDPGGPAAHVRRRLALDGLGWRVLDVHPSAWDGDVRRAVPEVLSELEALCR